LCLQFEDENSEAIRRMLSVVYSHRRDLEKPADDHDVKYALNDYYVGLDNALNNEEMLRLMAITGRATGDQSNFSIEGLNKHEEELRRELRFVEWGRMLLNTKLDRQALSIIEGTLDVLKICSDISENV
jgi:hypothetical protein